MIIEKEKVIEWFNEAVLEPKAIWVEDSLIYKGFKIDNNCILDVRRSDMYNVIYKKDLKKFMKYGFVEGADRIMHDRDIVRLGKVKKAFLLHVTNKHKYKQNGNSKKYRYHQLEMLKVLDLQFLLECRIKQTKERYKWD